MTSPIRIHAAVTLSQMSMQLICPKDNQELIKAKNWFYDKALDSPFVLSCALLNIDADELRNTLSAVLEVEPVYKPKLTLVHSIKPCDNKKYEKISDRN